MRETRLNTVERTVNGFRNDGLDASDLGLIVDLFDECLRNLKTYQAGDRELLIRTAALVALGVTLRYPLGTPSEIAMKSVLLARQIVSEVDGEHDPAE